MLGEGVTPQRDAAHNIVKRKTNTNSMAIIGYPIGRTMVRARMVYPQRFDALVGESAFRRKSRQAIPEIELQTGCRADFLCLAVETACSPRSWNYEPGRQPLELEVRRCLSTRAMRGAGLHVATQAKRGNGGQRVTMPRSRIRRIRLRLRRLWLDANESKHLVASVLLVQ